MTDALTLFYSTSLVTGRAQSRATFGTQMETAVAYFYQSTSRTFLRTLNFIEQVFHGNAIISQIESNWYFISLAPPIQYASLWPQARSYANENGSCSCAVNYRCTSAAMIDQWLVPGFRVGCDSLQSLFQSTLECLSNSTCINQLKSIYLSSELIIQPLDSLLSSPNATVQSLINE